jgi:ABC-type phosphate transport system substrate-binding protein
MLTNRTVARAVTAAALTLASQAAMADIVVIASAKSPLTSVNAEQVEALYMGRTQSLPSGANASLTSLPDSSPVFERFHQRIAGKTPAQVKAIWARLTFTGKATPPRTMQSADDVKRFVASNPNALGYIEKSAVDASVRVVATID